MIEGALSALEGTVAPRGVVGAYRKAKVFIAKRVAHFDIPSEPQFDDESAALFRDEIARTETYLEYGSGGSTLLAHRFVKTLVSVESDRRFLTAVGRRLAAQESSATTRLFHARIGWTEEWGMPLFTRPTEQRICRWARYPRAPWRYFRALGLQPELILVDGRFRVACVLESLLNLTSGSPCRILVDDYRGRPHYHVLEQFTDATLFGRMALLMPRRSLDRSRVRQLVRHFCADPR